jgi:hypothetical protein
MKNSVFKMMFAIMATAFSLAIAGCGASAHVEKDNSINFSQFKTYSWISEKDKSLKDRNSNNLVDQHVKAAVAKELQKHGWVETKKRPDVLLDYNIMVEKNVKENNSPVYTRPYTRYYYNPLTRRLTGFYSPSQMLGYESYEIPYKEGTITIHMIDNRSDKLIWQGWATDEVNSRNLTAREINSSVHSIMKKFKPTEG